MNFLTLQQELAAQVGLDQTVGAQAILLKRWLNNSQQAILRAYEWPFLRSPTPLVIQTVLDYTTGTVATVAGSTSVTFSGTIATSKTGQYIQTVDSSDWYKISAHTGGTATATLEIAAINTNSVATYTIRKFYYSTATSVDRIIQIFQDVQPYQLQETTPEYFQAFNPGFLGSGTPRIYCMAGIDSTTGSGTPQFRLWPSPDSVFNLRIEYYTVATDMSADADISVIPAKWHTTVLLEGAKSQGLSFMDDSKYKTSLELFQMGVDEMKNEYENSLHRHRVMGSIDNQPWYGNPDFQPLPFNYPRV